MHKNLNPETVIAPFSNYSQAVEVPAGARWLYISGQVGVAADGTTGDGFEQQCDLAFQNVVNLLEAGDMRAEHLVKVTVFLTRAEDLPAYRAARDRVLGEVRPASTLIVIAALARPQWLIEIEAVAAKGKGKPTV